MILAGVAAIFAAAAPLADPVNAQSAPLVAAAAQVTAIRTQRLIANPSEGYGSPALILVVAGGMTPRAALVSATVGAAELLGIWDVAGTHADRPADHHPPQ